MVLLEDFIIIKNNIKIYIINIIKIIEDKVGPPKAKIDIKGVGININSIEVGSKIPSKIKLKSSREVLSPSKI